MAEKTIHAIVSGKVQGVFFRDYTMREATRLGLTGWVRNLPDGTVETVISGDSETVKQMVAWLHSGSPLSRVDNVAVQNYDIQESFTAFTVRY